MGSTLSLAYGRSSTSTAIAADVTGSRKAILIPIIQLCTPDPIITFRL
jgi:hypothetical protein